MTVRTAAEGDKVIINLTGWLENGDIFDTTENDLPFSFILGDESVITGLQNAVIGMRPFEIKEVQILPDEGFGEYLEELVLEIDKERISLPEDLTIGNDYELTMPNGDSLIVTINELKDNSIIVDANEPLAGKVLNYRIELLKIE